MIHSGNLKNAYLHAKCQHYMKHFWLCSYLHLRNYIVWAFGGGIKLDIPVIYFMTSGYIFDMLEYEE